MSSVAAQLVNAEEFFRRPRPNDGTREELVRGEVVVTAMPGYRHGRVAQLVGYRILRYLETHRIGNVTSESGVRTEDDPDTVRGPVVSYWSYERVPEGADPISYPNLAADLCVEVRSPSNTATRLREKIAEYFRANVRMV